MGPSQSTIVNRSLQSIINNRITYSKSFEKVRVVDQGIEPKKSQSLNMFTKPNTIEKSTKSSPVKSKSKVTKKEPAKPKGKPVIAKWATNAGIKEVESNPQKSVLEAQDSVDIDDEVVVKPKVVKNEPVIVKSKKELEQEESIRSMFDNDEVVAKKPLEELPIDQPKEIESITQEQVPKKRIRKQRRVLKQQTVMEGKYMKTIDVECWESYSEDEQVKVLKPKKQKFVQKSMKSFFSKK